MANTYKITISYDGTLYHGWQKQSNQPTIQETIEKAISSITGEIVSLTGAGRTDAGVHALAQVAHFHLTNRKKPDKLLAGMNALIPPDIAIKSVEEVNAAFHARYLAKKKTYRYFIRNSPIRSPHDRQTAWHIKIPLHLTMMRTAASHLIGERDFSSLVASDHDSKNSMVDLKEIQIVKKGEQIIITLVASRFLKYMVRNIVGLLVEVGIGRRLASDIVPILEGRDRRLAGRTAPPHGLFLVDVNYGFSKIQKTEHRQTDNKHRET